MRRAEARLSASIINNSSIRCMSTGWQGGCITNTSAPRTFSWICTYASPPSKGVTCACRRAKPRKWQTSSQSASLAVPQKTLNLSSTRARCCLRSGFSSVIGFFSAAVFSAVVVATVAIVSVLSSRFSVLGFGAPASLLRTENWQLRTGFLAGPLGFEPRQSAPKALDLPLVDGPVQQFAVCTSIVVQPLSFNNRRLTTAFQQQPCNNRKSTIQNSLPTLRARQRTGRHGLKPLLSQTVCRFRGAGRRPEQPVKG